MINAGTSAGIRQSGKYIYQLESLRGWAILLVLAFHYFGIIFGSEPVATGAPFWMQLAGAGNTGVTLFFVLSGFLLALPFITAVQKNTVISIKNFYWARVLRIVPLYYIAVCIAWFMTGNINAAGKALIFIPIGFDMFPYSVPWWSLSTEVQFYLLLPWLMMLLRFRAGRWLVFFSLSLWAGGNIYLFHQPDWLGNFKNWHLQASLFGRGFAFLSGIGAAWLYSLPRYAFLTSSPIVVWAIFLATCLALFELLCWYGTMGQFPAFKAMPMYHNIEALLWSIVLLCSIALKGRLKILFFNSALEHFGRISFSLYLVHVPIFIYLISPLKSTSTGFSQAGLEKLFFLILASFALSWFVAVITYNLIEKPFLRFKAHLPLLTAKSTLRPSTPEIEIRQEI